MNSCWQRSLQQEYVLVSWEISGFSPVGKFYAKEKVHDLGSTPASLSCVCGFFFFLIYGCFLGPVIFVSFTTGLHYVAEFSSQRVPFSHLNSCIKVKLEVLGNTRFIFFSPLIFFNFFLEKNTALRWVSVETMWIIHNAVTRFTVPFHYTAKRIVIKAFVKTEVLTPFSSITF